MRCVVTAAAAVLAAAACLLLGLAMRTTCPEYDPTDYAGA